MTPKQRWLSYWQGVRPDRTPCDYWGTGEMTSRLMDALGCGSERELWKRLGIDKCIFLAPVHPRATEKTWHIPSLFSIWGIETKQIPYLDGAGVYEEAVNPPLAGVEEVAALDDFPWPKAGDWDFSGFRAECESWRDYPIVACAFEPFYLYCRLRGMELALADLVERPLLMGAVMERVYDVHATLVRRAMEEAGEFIDFIYVAEDLGTQESLLMSPRAFRNCIRPWLEKMVNLAHSLGAKAFHHDDGAIRPLIPDLIEMGIDLLNPVQWRCRGMDRESLARDFGDRLVFHGGVDNQHTLPFGTPDDVRREVEENLRVFRSNGVKGYIVSPCHNVQVNTPVENLLALYEAVQKSG